MKQKLYCNKFNKRLKNGPHQRKKKSKSTPLLFPQWVRWAVGCPGSLGVSRGHCACQGYAHCPGPVHVAHTVLLVLTLFEKMLSGSRLEFLGPLFYAFCSFPLPGSMCLRMIFLGNSWLIVFLLSYFFPVTGNAEIFFFFQYLGRWDSFAENEMGLRWFTEVKRKSLYITKIFRIKCIVWNMFH